MVSATRIRILPDASDVNFVLLEVGEGNDSLLAVCSIVGYILKSYRHWYTTIVAEKKRG